MNKIFILLLLISFQWGISQTEITWDNLSDVTFVEEYFEDEDAYFYVPSFGKSLLKLEGQKVSITGFILAIDYELGFYILSRHPFASCFFCGSGGPESIIELRFNNENVSFSMDEIVTIQGTLRLNSNNPDECNFILENASVRID